MDTAKTLWQAAASHCANTTALKHFDQLLFSWAVGQSEVFPESLADALRIKPVSVIRLSNQVRAEIQQCSHQSRNLFPLNRSYISTMNRFASSDIGPLGRVPNLNRGSAMTYSKARPTSASSSIRGSGTA